MKYKIVVISSAPSVATSFASTITREPTQLDDPHGVWQKDKGGRYVVVDAEKTYSSYTTGQQPHALTHTYSTHHSTNFFRSQQRTHPHTALTISSPSYLKHKMNILVQ
jgi:hypothetical protein